MVITSRQSATVAAAMAAAMATGGPRWAIVGRDVYLPFESLITRGSLPYIPKRPQVGNSHVAFVLDLTQLQVSYVSA